MPEIFFITETEEDDFPLPFIIILVIVITSVLITIMVIIFGIVHYKKRKLRRASANQEFEIPLYTEVSCDYKETSHTKPIKMQKNAVYGVENQLHHGEEGREYEVIQPQSPSKPTASQEKTFRLNVTYGVTEQK